jgi:thiol-disulfide isomerase/thioredoxin
MEPVLVRLLLVLGLVAAVGLLGWLWRQRDGRLRVTAAGARAEASPVAHDVPAFDAPADDVPAFDGGQLASVGLDLDGARAGAVLLTSPTCGPCATVKRILTELGDERDDVRWVAVEAADHLDLARDHHVMRVPTLFVLDPEGRILARTSGVPARAELERVIDRQGAHSSLA